MSFLSGEVVNLLLSSGVGALFQLMGAKANAQADMMKQLTANHELEEKSRDKVSCFIFSAFFFKFMICCKLFHHFSLCVSFSTLNLHYCPKYRATQKIDDIPAHFTSTLNISQQRFHQPMLRIL